jgi:20S proteasome alpha/beta subunit
MYAQPCRIDALHVGSQDRAVKLAKDVFIAAAERDIQTGDAVEIVVVTAAGITTERFPLRSYLMILAVETP